MDLKSLKALLKLLRSQGVYNYSTPELTLHLDLNIVLNPSRMPQDAKLLLDGGVDPSSEIEALLEYSSRSPVEDL